MIFISMLFSYSENVFAQQDSRIDEKQQWYKPDLFKIQYAGNIGFISLGLGYEWWRQNAQIDFMYGYVPETKGKTTIHTFTIKNTFKLYQFDVFDKYNLSPTVGFSVSMEPGENSYIQLPEKYPDGYYLPNSFYACINLGLKSNFKLKDERFFSSIDMYFEVNTHANYLFYNILAKENRSSNIYSLALGINVFF